LVAALMVPVTLEDAASAQSATVGSVLAAAKGAIAKQTGVHVAVLKTSSSAIESVVGDFGVKSGVETVTVGKDHVTFRVTPTYGYLSGDASGLTDIVDLSPAEVKKIGKDWVSVKAGTSQYASLSSGMSASSLTAVLPKAKGAKLSTEVSSGAHLYVIKWDTAATSSSPQLSSTLTLSEAGATLPVEQISTASGGSKETAKFSRWGETVRVSAPPTGSTIPFSKVTG
jgi:hypothetical protein